MWMIQVSLPLLFASVMLLVVGCAPDNAQRLIRARILTEVGDIETRRKSRLAKILDVLSPLNEVLPVHRVASRINLNLAAARVNLNAVEFIALQELLAVLAFVGYILWAGKEGTSVLLMITAPVIGFLVPSLWLQQRIQTRRDAIVRALPEAVDLLHLCVEAGVDFMGGLTRVVQESPKGPLMEELSTLLQEIRVGKQRREALRSLARRVNVPDMAAFVRALVQADRMGTGMSEALLILSEESRLRRYHRAERFAQKAPIKMLLPLMMIMGTVLIIVGGPIMLQFMRGDFMTNLKQPDLPAQVR